ncbi:hypothetical protein MCHI_002407 [Candidatus Magnetoovum chiemensis]|nr:hypothetical protein MCHI_002407 [Candidatus Magnetoovum chiemensis]
MPFLDKNLIPPPSSSSKFNVSVFSAEPAAAAARALVNSRKASAS